MKPAKPKPVRAVDTWADRVVPPASETAVTKLSLAVPIRDFLGGGEEDIDAPEPCVIDKLLPVGVPAALAGEPKAVKTYVAVDMGICIAAGIPWCGYAVKQGRVVLYLEEDTRAQVRRRLWWLARGHELDPRDLPLSVTAMAGVRLDDSAQLEQLIAECKGAALVVLDSLSRVHGADENDRTAMRAVTLALSRLAAETGACVMVIHHYRKSGAVDGTGKIRPGQRMRGSSDLHALVRAVIGVAKTAAGEDFSEIELSPESNYCEPIEPFGLRFATSTRDDGKRVATFSATDLLSDDQSAALAAIAEGAQSVDGVREALGCAKQKAANLVGDLARRGLIRRDPLRVVEA